VRGQTNNIYLVRPVIQTPNSGPRTVVFLREEGPNSFADGDNTYDGICEVCHTQTVFHRNDAGGDHSHHAGENCTQCHPHEADFAPMGGDCLECHRRPQPFGAGEYRRQIVENNGDGGGDFVRLSHHVTDGTQNQIVTPEDCEVCHDQSQHRTFTDGVSVLLNDPAGGDPILYDGTAVTLEPFCTGCHESVVPAPFSDGQDPPQIPPGWATSTHKTEGVTCFGDGTDTGCHANGHGSDNEKILQAYISLQDYTNYDPAAYELCWVCHSEQDIIYSQNNFENLHKKHVKDKKAPCLMCHSPHAPTDEGEPGQINFSFALEQGWDIQMIDGYDPSSAFWISQGGQRGYCYLRCHGKNHKPKDYDRNGGGGPGEPGDDGTGRDPGEDPQEDPAPGEIRLVLTGYPNPFRDQVRLRVQAEGPEVQEVLRLSICDVGGRIVRSLPVTLGSQGEVVLSWDGRDEKGRRLPTGLYLARIWRGKEGGPVCRILLLH
jgi:hypothetical protein